MCFAPAALLSLAHDVGIGAGLMPDRLPPLSGRASVSEPPPLGASTFGYKSGPVLLSKRGAEANGNGIRLSNMNHIDGDMSGLHSTLAMLSSHTLPRPAFGLESDASKVDDSQ